jgi:AraC family transcriptional regulator
MRHSPVTPLANGASNDPERRIYASNLVWIGAFRCPAGYPRRWGVENNSGERSLIAFPRTMVGIRQSGRPAIIADPTHAILYNPRQPYSRELVDPRGDMCEFFAVEPTTIVDAAREFDPDVLERPSAPFARTCTPASAANYFQQRRLFERVRRIDDLDSMIIDEAFVALLSGLISHMYAQQDRSRAARRVRKDTVQAHRDLVAHARAIIGREFKTRLTLEELAARVHASQYHLCRVFRRVTGMSIHQHMTQLRLRESLEHLGERDVDLSRLALELGFASHSHFTIAFQRVFGMPPSAARDRLRRAV